MAKIMITGATGLLGRAVKSQLEKVTEHQVIATGFSRAQAGIYKLDLTHADEIAQFIAQHKPDVIVHCAAERRPDVSEQNPSAALALNVSATKALAETAKKHGAWVIYISTDYVFDGTEPSYSESDMPNPVNFYGESKWKGEQALLKASNEFAVLRLPILYGRVEQVSESAILVLLNQLMDKQTQEVDHWAVRSPTSTQDIAQAIEKMIELKLNHIDLSGIYHFSGTETMSKYQMLLSLGEILGHSTQHLKSVSEPTDSAKRPKDCTLICDRLAKLGIQSKVLFREGMLASLGESPTALAKIGLKVD
ncbi:SDR family oxidoreductase [Shewanella eurypsychrophilus]|uniref:dTDP-4-dehydrorhamnose reductase n=1 Tax=Shewanella eurypsychrophilus TaxID=2593656 RepID=A0ABX6V3W3_9GAMM|nr:MULTISPECIES: SDR family oxidoreductase [Shewanella]QFU21191.1 sugar nucleotide-binding protein [Shewanella sp. YLB-09]QPG56482.1 SDR family oxidoreductase [Shewanella eurypsychrophilus]